MKDPYKDNRFDPVSEGDAGFQLDNQIIERCKKMI